MEWPPDSLGLTGDFEPRIIPRRGENYTHAACKQPHTSFQTKKDRQECLSHRRRVGLDPSLLDLSALNLCLLCRSHGPALLEAFAAEDRSPLRRAEGNCRFLPALRAVCLRFRAHWRRVSSPSSTALGPFCFAPFAALWFVLEAFVGKKHLFAGGEHKLRAAFCALQHLVVVFHEPLSPGPVSGRRLGGLCT